MGKIIIVSGGHAEDEFISSKISDSSYDSIICCDSGMGVMRRIGIKPDVILGDFDSVLSEDKIFFEGQRDITWDEYPSEKDGTDTELAVIYAYDKSGATAIDIYAATGTRIDHVLGNIELLLMGYNKKCPITIMDSHNRISLLGPGEYKFSKKDCFGHYVSHIPFAGPCKGVTFKGFKYDVDDIDIVPGNSLGVSNQINDDEVYVSIREGFLIRIESVD